MSLGNSIIFRLFSNLNKDEKFNFATHFIGLIANVLISPFLMLQAHTKGQFLAFLVYSIGASTMFACSSFYHLANNPIRKRVWQLLDYIAIFILIGSSYTAFILIYLNTPLGHIFLFAHWLIIAFGIAFRILEKEKFKSISLTLYIILGWMVILIFKDITANMTATVKTLLVAGGVFYTMGVYFFINQKIPLSHAIWHIFVILGVASHYMALFYS